MRSAGITFRTWLAAATCLTWVVPTLVHAQTTPAPPHSAAPALTLPRSPRHRRHPPPGYWINGIHLSAVIEAGIIANPSGPKLNIGQSFTDHPNQVQLNQVLIGLERKIDPNATGYDWAFKFSGMYGSDARYTHYLGFLDQALPVTQRNSDRRGGSERDTAFSGSGLRRRPGCEGRPLRHAAWSRTHRSVDQSVLLALPTFSILPRRSSTREFSRRLT